jgi:hypothetical protein
MGTRQEPRQLQKTIGKVHSAKLETIELTRTCSFWDEFPDPDHDYELGEVIVPSSRWIGLLPI